MISKIKPEHSAIILDELCKRVGVDSKTVDFSKPSWFEEHSWTKDEQQDFRDWLAGFLSENGYAKKTYHMGQKHSYYEASKMLSNYGWKVKE